MNANETQVGGDHYRSQFQHWDWVCDIKLHYLLGCASKYLTRWRKKNGKEDLEKSRHYIQKAKERGVIPALCSEGLRHSITRDFLSVNEIPQREADIIILLIQGVWDPALVLLDELIEEA